MIKKIFVFFCVFLIVCLLAFPAYADESPHFAVDFTIPYESVTDLPYYLIYYKNGTGYQLVTSSKPLSFYGQNDTTFKCDITADRGGVVHFYNTLTAQPVIHVSGTLQVYPYDLTRVWCNYDLIKDGFYSHNTYYNPPWLFFSHTPLTLPQVQNQAVQVKVVGGITRQLSILLPVGLAILAAFLGIYLIRRFLPFLMG